MGLDQFLIDFYDWRRSHSPTPRPWTGECVKYRGLRKISKIGWNREWTQSQSREHLKSTELGTGLRGEWLSYRGEQMIKSWRFQAQEFDGTRCQRVWHLKLWSWATHEPHTIAMLQRCSYHLEVTQKTIDQQFSSSKEKEIHKLYNSGF